MEPVEADGHFLYVRHGANAWGIDCGTYLDSAGWHSVPEPSMPEEDRTFYAARSPASSQRGDGAGLVSCLMPTAERRAFNARAIAYFQRQDYPDRELVVLDDGRDRIADLIPDDPRVHYFPLDERLVLGEKRNRLCGLARGEILVHWDDDDWYAPHRLSYQVEALERHGAAICGTSRVLYFDPSARRAWLYSSNGSGRQWISALCYRKALWRENRFSPIPRGEDTRFVWNRAAQSPLVLPDHRFFVATLHAENTSSRMSGGACWARRPLDEVRQLLGADYRLYEAGDDARAEHG